MEKSILNTDINKDILYESLNNINAKNILYNKIKTLIDNKYDIKDILLSIQKLKDDTNTEQIDEFIYDAIYNINKEQILIIKRVQETLSIILPEYASYLMHIVDYRSSDIIRIRNNIDSFFDKLYFAKSNFHKRFNNLCTKVIATFKKISDDNSFNNQTRSISKDGIIYSEIDKFLSNTEDNNTNDLKNILNNIFNGQTKAKFNAKDYFSKIAQIFDITKKIIDNEKQRNLIKMHTTLYINEFIYDIICNYISLLYEVADECEDHHNKHVTQCKDFIKQFGYIYDFIYWVETKKFQYVLKYPYPDNKLPEQTVKQVLDNPDEEFIIPYNKVSKLKRIKK